MLASTFRYINGIRRRAEQKLWSNGVTTLDQLLEREAKQLDLFLSGANSVAAQVKLFQGVIESKNFEALAKLLKLEDYYRVALEFPDDVLFLDIETTGLSRFYDKITLIGWRTRSRYRAYIRGEDPAPMLSALARASIVVTYNGTNFDLPFIRKEFPETRLPPIHIDLRYLARRVDLSGGQKAIESQIGLSRGKHVEEIDGAYAPVLWAQYRRGNLLAIKRLIRYNHADVFGLCAIFDETAQRLLRRIEAPLAICQKLPKFAHKTRLRIQSRPIWPKKAATAITIFPYVANESSFTRLRALYRSIGRSDLAVVGIDLTGSESKPSGWCALNQYTARTKAVLADSDLIAVTMRQRPDLVSIDSPLSLPKGRKSVFDDDPGRSEFGIMRVSERILKRRGINVYPSLIPSMQRLTARGIRLAAEFRRRGVPVIESYPGAAQDIMNIPRKGAGVELLKAGLGEFGVRGKFLRETVTHDELDAITSALVGIFFFAGKFEALGDEDEEALIVPSLTVDSSEWLTQKVVGFSGGLASGKTTAALILEKEEFFYGRYSMVLSQRLSDAGVQLSRAALQNFGLSVNRERGQRWLGRELLRRLPKAPKLTIDGMRFPDDHAFLVEKFGLAFRHVFLEATTDVRRNRYESRVPAEMTFDVAASHEVEQGIASMNELSHATIVNNGSDLAQFSNYVKRVVGEITCQ